MFQALTQESEGKVALKGIVRSGAAAQNLQRLPLDSFDLPEFKVPGREIQKAKDENLVRIQVLEREISESKRTLEASKAEAKRTTESAAVKAREEGLVAGRKEGESKATKEFATQVAALQAEVAKSIQNINAAYGERVRNIQSESLELALGIAKKLFSIEAETHPERIAIVLNEAFSHLGQAESVVLHLHPLDVKYAEESQSVWQPLNTSLKSVRLESDERVDRGGCWIESTGGGTVDLRTQVVLDRIETMVRTAIGQALSDAEKV